MASSSNLLSQDQFLCPICLAVFIQPVSTPCGHNFCLSCITSYWNNAPICQCPICKHKFKQRPDLKVNTFISGLAEQFMLLQVTDVHTWSPDQQQQAHFGNTVMCDICTDGQQEAVKSCLECLTSYCKIHLEPHKRVAGLKRHTLVQPLTNLEDRICKEHNKLFMLFCRNEEVLLCNACATSHHPNHKTIHVEEAYTDMKNQLGNKEAKVQKMIQERLQKVCDVKESVKQSEAETKDAKASCVRDLTALVCEIQRNQAELVRMMEQKQKAAEKQAGDFINSIEREIAELQGTTVKLRELKQTQDQLLFLRKLSVASLPYTMDLSTWSFNSHEEMQQIKMSLSRSVSQLQMSVDRMNAKIHTFSDNRGLSNSAALRYMQQYEVDIVLDPDSAHPFLTLSNDRKGVRYNSGSILSVNSTLNLNMFTEHLAVLSCGSFKSCKFYFEVFVGAKTEWCLGVAAASVQRRGRIDRHPQCGLWALWFLRDKFETFSSPNVPVRWGKVETVGVFVDYDAGQVSFCDVTNATVIYSFSECGFTEELYPYFNPCDDEYGSNLDPIVLVPVSHAE